MKGGVKMKEKNGFLSSLLLQANNRFFKFMRETAVKINSRISYLRKTLRTDNFGIKIVS